MRKIKNYYQTAYITTIITYFYTKLHTNYTQ